MYQRNLGVLSAAAAAVVTGSVTHAALLVEMRMNETGTAAINTATGTYDSDADTNTPEVRVNDGFMRQVSGGPAVDLHTAGGLGVSGALTDRAFDSGGATGGAVFNTIPGTWRGQDFTVSGWLKTAGPTPWGGGNDGVVQSLFWGFSGGANAGRIRESSTADSPELWLATTAEGGNTTYGSSTAMWEGTEEWVFWAVSFEGSAASNTARAKFYAGTTSDSVSLVATADGPSRTNAWGDSFWWGQDTSFLVGVNGLLDNLRFHDEAVDMTELEALRAFDVIPEPASLGLLAAGALATLGRRRDA